jgi:hypothetical protein
VSGVRRDVTDAWFAGEHVKYGIDHPTWREPTNFYYQSEQQARDAIHKVYGEDAEHVVVVMRVIPDPRVLSTSEGEGT